MTAITERSDGAYTSAFASWANGWRALQWQEKRQRVAETQRRVNYQKAENTSRHLEEKHEHKGIKACVNLHQWFPTFFCLMWLYHRSPPEELKYNFISHASDVFL